MNGWLVVGALVVIAVLVVLAVTRTRPRTADELLSEPVKSAPPSPRPAGPESPKELINSLVARRSTGVLVVQSGPESCSISMLFGHIFDASCGTFHGEEALQRALGWSQPTCHFDPIARLSTNETITAPTRSLLESLGTGPPALPP